MDPQGLSLYPHDLGDAPGTIHVTGIQPVAHLLNENNSRQWVDKRYHVAEDRFTITWNQKAIFASSSTEHCCMRIFGLMMMILSQSTLSSQSLSTRSLNSIQTRNLHSNAPHRCLNKQTLERLLHVPQLSSHPSCH